MDHITITGEPQRYWPDNTTYFLTGSTFLHFPYFRSAGQKLIVLNQIKKLRARIEISDVVFSVAINHYHLKFFLRYGLDLAKVKQLMHGGTSYEYRERFMVKYKDLWQSSRTYQILSEETNWKITGYIIGNLLKHKEVSTFQELLGNSFSSYGEVAKRYGEEFAQRLVYSAINVDEDSKGFVDIKGLENHYLRLP